MLCFKLLSYFSLVLYFMERFLDMTVLFRNIVCMFCFYCLYLPHQHGRSALDTSRTLFLLASTQGVSCRLVMNHLIYMYMFSLITPPPPPPPPPHIYVSKCMYVYVHIMIYLFSCPNVPAPQLLIFHREYLS